MNLYLKIDNRALPARGARNYWQDNEQSHCKEAKHRYSSRYVSSNDEKYIETGAERKKQNKTKQKESRLTEAA